LRFHAVLSDPTLLNPRSIEGYEACNRRKLERGIWITPCHTPGNVTSNVERPIFGPSLKLAEGRPRLFDEEIFPDIGTRKVIDRGVAGFQYAIPTLCIRDNAIPKNDLQRLLNFLETRRAGIIPNGFMAGERL